uniref:Uncharacterized protein n=1 Tax=Ascaris lumbricoides TaxID=6252 RepID=A0A9J2PEK9_ASCLU
MNVHKCRWILCIDFLTFIYYKGGKIAAVFLLKRIPFGYDGESCDTFKDKKVFYGHGGIGELGRNEARNSIPDEDDVMYLHYIRREWHISDIPSAEDSPRKSIWSALSAAPMAFSNNQWNNTNNNILGGSDNILNNLTNNLNYLNHLNNNLSALNNSLNSINNNISGLNDNSNDINYLSSLNNNLINLNENLNNLNRNLNGMSNGSIWSNSGWNNNYNWNSNSSNCNNGNWSSSSWSGSGWNNNANNNWNNNANWNTNFNMVSNLPFAVSYTLSQIRTSPIRS